MKQTRRGWIVILLSLSDGSTMVIVVLPPERVN